LQLRTQKVREVYLDGEAWQVSQVGFLTTQVCRPANSAGRATGWCWKPACTRRQRGPLLAKRYFCPIAHL
jgi:hypothetical protein